MRKKYKILFLISIFIICISIIFINRGLFEKIWIKELNKNDTVNAIAHIASVKDGYINIDVQNVLSQDISKRILKNKHFSKDMFVDDSSIGNYFILKSTNEESNNILYDFSDFQVYELNSSRYVIIAETLNYLYLSNTNGDSVYLMAFSKVDKKIKEIGMVFSSKSEYFQSSATSNYTNDKICWCYAVEGSTYLCRIEKEIMTVEKLLDESLSSVISTDTNGESYFSIYNTRSTPYIFEPSIITKQDDHYVKKIINLEFGQVMFSIIYDGCFYMGYNKNGKLEIYSISDEGILKKLNDYDGGLDIKCHMINDKIYIVIDKKVFICKLQYQSMDGT